MWTILKLIEWTTDYFKKHEIPNPRLDAELLLSHTLDKKRIDLYLSFDKTVSEKDLATFKEYIRRRVKREPLQYITGVQDFYGVPIKVTPDVLIPRPETELMVEQTLKLVTGHESRITICDLCTGSGCIIAALASELPNAQLTGTDISEKALEVAKFNTKNWKERITLMNGDLFAPLLCKHAQSSLEGEVERSLPHPNPPLTKGRKWFDLIVSNPPYVPEDEFSGLQPEVRDFEPRSALTATDNGLEIIKRIINDASTHLVKGGTLIMEIGDKQAEEVRSLIANNGSYDKVEMLKDYGGIERVIWTSLL
ncbi:MAG: protein-(glutamine-N5) methyltransferase, release factor-specific [Deltaproteobacteria bacterium CG11_big_fil_rev_8_21_14_0_20_49_13]|nr:MAG: protein-(glutamine-N5) methyltransferase, release factor-specific [Deltaproteobacteria bacterium CG11_big_fil_rev_8_21_14_0_20_49_13]